MRRVKQFLALSPLEKHTVARAAVLLPLCAVSLRLGGYRSAREKMLGQAGASSSLPAGEDLPRARSIARAVEIAANHSPWRFKCLTRSLVLARILARHGISSEVRIGAATSADRLAAHAWVISGDVILNDDPDISDRFSPFEKSSKDPV